MKYLTTTFFFFVILAQLSGQKQLTIKFTPDAFPQDVTWELQNQDYRGIVAEGDLTGCSPNEECVVFEEMVEDRCYTLVVRDANSDGSGSYEVFYDGMLMFSRDDFNTDKTYDDFNCTEGETCALAIQLNLPDNKIYAPDTKEFWFKFTPEEDGHYRINTCDNRVTTVGVADTELWYYKSCNRFIHASTAEGAESYSDDEAECAPGSGFNFIPLEAGIEYYIRHKPQQDWLNIPKNDSLKIKVQKLPVRNGCTDPEACNYDPFAQLDNGTCDFVTGCAPDLSLDSFELRESIMVDTVFSNDQCFIEEGCLTGPGPREVIRFSTKIDNIGNADYWVGRPENSENLFSQINCHGHYHHLGYAEYLLYEGQGEPTPIGFKSGFCVLDLDCSDAGGALPKYICANMGISKGCSDIYNEEIDCQWVDITDIEDGQYTIIVRVNQFELVDARGMAEKTYENNVGRACVDIDRSTGVLIVTVEEDCEVYRDCAGVINGLSSIDCKGVCGGDAHWGDVDGTGDVELSDLEGYLDLLVNKITGSESCLDLNDDGKLSIYEADLIAECLQIDAANIDNPFHEHCSFPSGSEQPDQVATLRINDFDPGGQTFVVEGWFADRNLTAFQIATSGIQIESIEKLYGETPDYLLHNDETLFAVHNTEQLSRNTGFQPLFRINYSAVTADSICLTRESEMINSLHNRISLELDNVCEFISSNKDIRNHASISLLPNPAKDKMRVFADGQRVHSYSIASVAGEVISTQVVDTQENFTVNVESLNEGLYLMQLRIENGQQLTKRFVIAR